MENTDILGCIFGLFCFSIICFILYFLISIPITIAKKRGIKGSELTTITILSRCSLLIGVTWFVALALSLVYKPQNWVGETASSGKGQTMATTDIDNLLKLNELKEKEIITQQEFEEQKKKLLDSI